MNVGLWGALSNFLDRYTGQNHDSPDAQSPIVLSWQQDLKLVRALYAGWQELYENRARYLPAHPKEAPEDYFIRANRRTFYNGFGRTIRALAGAAFSQPPTPEGVPAEILAFYEDDIDNQGTAGDAFCRHTLLDALTTGMAGIFVDTPVLERSPDTPEPTRAQELDAGIRPYWKLVRKDDIKSFRIVVENGKTLLAQFVFCERAEEPKGEYGVKIIERLRAYRRLPMVPGAAKPTIFWEIYERDEGKTKWISVGTGELPAVTEIPLAQIYTERLGFMDSAPPLLDLANVNLLHYQTSSDMYHSVHIANVPFLFGGGFDVDALEIGPNRAVIVPSGIKSADAWLRWVEHTGAQIGSTRACLADLEEQMAHLGLGMLQRKSRAAETAEKASLDRKDQESTLGAAISDLENGLEQALFWTAQYMGLESGGRFSFSRAFELEPVASDRTENQGAKDSPPDPKKPGATNNPRTTET